MRALSLSVMHTPCQYPPTTPPLGSPRDGASALPQRGHPPPTVANWRAQGLTTTAHRDDGAVSWVPGAQCRTFVDGWCAVSSAFCSQSMYQRVKVTGFPAWSRSGARSVSSARQSDQMVPRWVPLMINHSLWPQPR